MHLVRPIFAAHPKVFGRAPVRELGQAVLPSGIADDIKLFAMTFLAGFLFVSVLIG
jgi:hypothetical protein